MIFVLGPSGAGKSGFARFLTTRHHWLHLEIDQDGGDGIDLHNLRSAWNSFYESKNPTDLAEELRKRAKQAGRTASVLSFPSSVVLSPEHIAVAEKTLIRIVYLYGSAAHCIDAFLKRERTTGRNLGLDHWIMNNCAPYFMMSQPSLGAYRVHVFTADGTRRPHEDVSKQLFGA
jgi:shikimate kinase